MRFWVLQKWKIFVAVKWDSIFFSRYYDMSPDYSQLMAVKKIDFSKIHSSMSAILCFLLPGWGGKFLGSDPRFFSIFSSKTTLATNLSFEVLLYDGKQTHQNGFKIFKNPYWLTWGGKKPNFGVKNDRHVHSLAPCVICQKTRLDEPYKRIPGFAHSYS